MRREVIGLPPAPTTLESIAAAGDDGAPVAFGRGGSRSRADLRRDADALAARLQAVGTGRWLLCSRDSYAAAVALLALARCRCVAVLPPNQQPDTLRRAAAGAVGALSDPGDAEALPPGLAALDPLAQPAGRSTAPAALDRDAPLVEFHTSGTTGDARPVLKALRHLEDEVAVLERRFGDRVPADARVFATASHQHIYGLLFRVLWPLVSGRPFQAETLLHARELLPRMVECRAAVLATTPVHLKRMVATPGLRELRGVCRAVFSSGGPLPADTAKAVAEQLGAAPFEVFGSTETGGVAVRQRDVHGEEWEPLPGVAVDRLEPDGRLVVTSPFVSVGEALPDGRGRAVMGDRVELCGDGFRHLGRADRVVKVGEKRLSLPEMEQHLAAHPWVAEAALLLRHLGGEARVHAVVALAPDGRAALERAGRRGLRAALETHLAERYDPVVVPRAWRIAPRLPRDAQDKLPAAALSALFDGDEEGDAEPRAAGRPRAPRLLSEAREARRIERRLAVPEDLAQVEGHFEGFPVVPGVVQLAWALAAAAALLGSEPELRALEALKFPVPLRPGGSIRVCVEVAADRTALRFSVHADGAVTASGRARLAEGPRP